mgnify:CR=1 FL=1
MDRSISQLGNTVADDNRDMSYSGSLWWQPTTGEFGPRGGFGDLEHHEKLSTQFGLSTCSAREGRYAPIGSAPKATQIKLSDSVNPFEISALADTVTVSKLTYQVAVVRRRGQVQGVLLPERVLLPRAVEFRGPPVRCR